MWMGQVLEGNLVNIVQRSPSVSPSQFPSTSSSSASPCHQLTTVGKTVLTYEIPLYDSGPAGLGVTIYGKSMLNSATKRPGDVGVYIKNVMPGGAAALVSV